MKTRIIFPLLMLIITSMSFAQGHSYQLSTHILDISKGVPAPNVKIKLEKLNAADHWKFVDEKFTDENGRISDFLENKDAVSNDGIYKFTFYTSPYFENDNEKSFYPFIEVVFEIKDNNHYHVPITLSPFGYSTYRGS